MTSVSFEAGGRADWRHLLADYCDHGDEAQRSATVWPPSARGSPTVRRAPVLWVNLPEGVEMFDYEGEVAVVAGLEATGLGVPQTVVVRTQGELERQERRP